MSEQISNSISDYNDIYDRTFKRMFQLSDLAIINLINGLFGTNYPLDSKVDLLNRESVNAVLKKHYADVFVEIHGVTYHLEAQMKKDGFIVVRVFEYGFYTALEHAEDGDVLCFPEPIVIYLDEGINIPESSELELDFGTQGRFTYRVKNYVYQKHEIKELNQKKLIILIPFQILKLKRIIKGNKIEESLQALQSLVNNDIMNSIEANLKVGNITVDDASQLKEMTALLYKHIIKNYEALGGLEEMKELLPGALELPLDKYRIQIDELTEKLTQKDNALMQKNEELTQKDNALTQKNEELTQRDNALTQKDEELRRRKLLTKLLIEQNRQEELVQSMEDETVFDNLVEELGIED